MNSVSKALKILTELSNEKGGPLTVKALADKLQINRSTCSHIVKTLKENGFVERVSHTEGYVLGPEAYFLSRFGKYAENEITICRPILKWLYKKTGYPVILSTIKNGKKFIIEYFDFEHKVFPDKQNIRYDDIYRTATGRAMLANMSADEIKNIYAIYSAPDEGIWPEVTSLETLVGELSKMEPKDAVITRHKLPDGDMVAIGYGCAIFKGINCIGAVGIALSMSEAEYTVFADDEKKLINMLKKAVKEINRRMNYG